ncbi:hypothetical protein OH687_19790 [Burkholderia anthina]|nr:hypothetical protein OH687_19790 [Burkholderia anthina]
MVWFRILMVKIRSSKNGSLHAPNSHHYGKNPEFLYLEISRQDCRGIQCTTRPCNRTGRPVPIPTAPRPRRRAPRLNGVDAALGLQQR